MSNVVAVESGRDRLYIKGANGAEWSMTRAQIQAIWQSKTGSAAARRAATIADVIASAVAALGQDTVGASPLFDLDPTNTLADMRLTLGL